LLGVRVRESFAQKAVVGEALFKLDTKEGYMTVNVHDLKLNEGRQYNFLVYTVPLQMPYVRFALAKDKSSQDFVAHAATSSAQGTTTAETTTIKFTTVEKTAAEATTTGTADPCSTIKCGADCSGTCGWNTILQLQGLPGCESGGYTSFFEHTAGACPESSFTSATSTSQTTLTTPSAVTESATATSTATESTSTHTQTVTPTTATATDTVVSKTTTSTALCNGNGDPLICGRNYKVLDCLDPIFGSLLRVGCPVMCSSCIAATASPETTSTKTATTMATGTTTTSHTNTMTSTVTVAVTTTMEATIDCDNAPPDACAGDIDVLGRDSIDLLCATDEIYHRDCQYLCLECASQSIATAPTTTVDITSTAVLTCENTDPNACTNDVKVFGLAAVLQLCEESDAEFQKACAYVCLGCSDTTTANPTTKKPATTQDSTQFSPTCVTADRTACAGDTAQFGLDVVLQLCSEDSSYYGQCYYVCAECEEAPRETTTATLHMTSDITTKCKAANISACQSDLNLLGHEIVQELCGASTEYFSSCFYLCAGCSDVTENNPSSTVTPTSTGNITTASTSTIVAQTTTCSRDTDDKCRNYDERLCTNQFVGADVRLQCPILCYGCGGTPPTTATESSTDKATTTEATAGTTECPRDTDPVCWEYEERFCNIPLVGADVRTS
jgi:hypothetical protein